MTSSGACNAPMLLLKVMLLNMHIYLNSLTMFGGQVCTSVEMNSKKHLIQVISQIGNDKLRCL